jgi:hypothetical protein
MKRTTNTNLFSFRNIQRKPNVFKWYGTFYRKALDALLLLLCRMKVKKTVATTRQNQCISGDTRFDRVATILKNNDLDYISQFKTTA